MAPEQDSGTRSGAAGHAAGHPPFLAHHWETPGQQFQAGKTGMWLFLSTEILLFGGLFCAYAVYRHNHPEIFLYAHRFLDKTLGGINTLVLILSSLTAAWAVRAAQLNQQRLLRGLIVATLLCGCGFMGIKAVEYEAKWKHGLLWGKRFQPMEHAEPGPAAEAAGAASAPAAPGHAEPGATPPLAAPATHGTPESVSPAAAGHGQPGAVREAAAPADPLEIRSNIPPSAIGPSGLASETVEAHGGSPSHAVMDRPRNVQVFFSIYFAMTGLHALHVLAGMTAWLWVLRRALRGHFSGEYYTPVDLVALYWHLVDLIWIYLFPLLYLIH